jgi:GT2 family glycosyltransferase
MQRIYIFLPVHNRRETTRRFIQCLRTQTFEHYHLVLIDDGSSDRTEEMVRREMGNLTVLKGDGSWWWAGCLQQGYLWLKSGDIDRSDVVLLINDDTEFEPTFLEKAMSLLQGKSRILLFAQNRSRQTGRTYFGFHVDWPRFRIEHATTPEEIGAFPTRGLFLRVGDFLEIGGFHPKLLPHYGSDLEFTLRAARKGMTLLTDPSLWLSFDEDLIRGYAKFKSEPWRSFIKSSFSRRSPDNPFLWTLFIALACPWPWKMSSWLRVWASAFLLFYRRLLPAPEGNRTLNRW